MPPFLATKHVWVECGCDGLERHRNTGGAGAGALGDALAKPEQARRFHDNTARPLPEGRAAEIAARTFAVPGAQSVEDLTALLTSARVRCDRGSYRTRTA
jgi:hypothetical protein